MNEWIVVGLAALACAGVILIERRKARALMERLDEMLDAAIDGTFSERAFDETLLSAVESRLNRYLMASAVSARNLSTEKAKIQTLLADISHQTKTPIANIRLYAQLLAEQELPPESRDCVAALDSQTEKLSFLITSLVKLSRLETGVFTLRPSPASLTPMLAAVADQFGPIAAEKGLTLTVEETDATAVFDGKWTAEAVGNLLDNAIKYTPAGGTVRVSATAYELFTRIDVADTGVGVAEGERAEIFSRFYRSPSAAAQEGVGIGLYLAREILAGQGGYIKVSGNPGGGSIFSVFLPRKAE